MKYLKYLLPILIFFAFYFVFSSENPIMGLLFFMSGSCIVFLCFMLIEYIYEELFLDKKSNKNKFIEKESIIEKQNEIDKFIEIVENDNQKETLKEKPSVKSTFKEKIDIANNNENLKLQKEEELKHNRFSEELDKMLSNVLEETSLLYTNYKLTRDEVDDEYPIIKFAKGATSIRKPRIGAINRRGYKEESFQMSLERYFSNSFEVIGNARINTGTRPYEPDIALISKSDFRINIDVEIDEPYSGISRKPIHCIGEDKYRDIFFKERGWIVIRFSEYQIHTQEKSCLKFIAELINDIDTSFIIPQEINGAKDLVKDKVWTRLQAQKWEKGRYRENYLNHEFEFLDEDENRVFDLGLNLVEKEQEAIVKSLKGFNFVEQSVDEKLSFNKTNIHPRDKRIAFFSKEHYYTIDNVPFPSVSQVVSSFFPEFDSIYWSEYKARITGRTAESFIKEWKEKGRVSREKGTFLHEQIENYFLGKEYIRTEEFYQFENFINDHTNLIPYRSEWRIFDDKYNLAGTIDFIIETDNGFDIYDWKRSEKIIDQNRHLPIILNKYLNSGLGILSHISDTSFNRYCLQQNLYKYILENNYQMQINNMFLVVFHPEHNKYYKVKVPNLNKEVENILNSI